MKKAVAFLAEGFEETEAIAPIDMLRRAGVSVTTAAIGETAEVRGSHDIFIRADRLFEELDYEGFDLFILPGGGKGTENLEASEKLKKVLLEADSKGKYLAAICAAPRVLGKLSLLKGQRAICYPGNEKYLTGAEIASGERAVISGRFITSRGMGTAVDFGAALIEVLEGKEKAQDVLNAIQF